MLSLITIFSLILGTIVGSFLLVVSQRYNTGKSLNGRSECFSCGKTLTWKELFPIFSYLALKGRCKGCSSLIPKDAMFAELLTGVIFVAVSIRSVFTTGELLLTESYLMATLWLMLIASVLIIIFFYDLRHKIIPDNLSFLFGILSFVSLFYFGFENEVFMYTGFAYPQLLDVLAGVLIPLPFALIWLFSKGRMMGLGDAKLMVGIGFLLGLSLGVSAVFASFWLGTLVIISFLVIERVFNIKLLGSSKEGIMKQEIPFGPFLIAATLFVVVTHFDLF